LKPKNDLNPEQERAVHTTSGPLLVLAGAGTGKTRVVTARIARILEEGISPESICALTFTNKAAREMRERVKRLIGKDRARGVVVSTFHSLGLRIVREFGDRIGIPAKATVADSADQLALLSDALREVGLPRTAIRPGDAHFRISLWKSAGRDPEEVFAEATGDLEPALAAAWMRYEGDLRRRQLLDFDDMVVRPLELLEKHTDVREQLQERWSHLLVDEYQDTSTCQDRLLRVLAGRHRNLCVVGDDDQSIYGWRGADADRILRFTRDWHGAAVVTLDRNYRSTAPILEASGRLISCNLTRREKTLKPCSSGGHPVTLFVANDEHGETAFLTGQITRMRMQENLRYEDCAILFRANSQCRTLEQALRGQQMPYRVVGTRSFFDRREVRDLLAFLRIASNPSDDQALLRVVNTPPRGIGRGSIDRMAELAAKTRSSVLAAFETGSAELGARPREGVQKFLTLLSDIRERSAKQGVANALAHLIEESGYRHHLKQTVEDALELNARLAAVDSLLEAVTEIAQSDPSAGLAGVLDALALNEGDRDKDDDEQGYGVTLMTLHAAKGLEFPVVFIVGLEEGLLPHGNAVGDEEECDDKGVEEERRLLYVGLTRAKNRLFLSRAVSRRKFGRESLATGSRFLEEIGLEHLDVIREGKEPPAEADSGKAWLAAIKDRLGRASDEAASPG